MENNKRPRYTDLAQFTCLEDLRESSIELSLVHCGKEQCHPSYLFQGIRKEFIIHFVIRGKGIYTTGSRSWSLTPGMMFLIYPDTEITYIADSADPWEYAWFGFKGILSENILYHCGLSRQNPVSQVLNVSSMLLHIDDLLDHRQLTYSNELYRQGLLMQIFSELVDNNTEKLAENPLTYDYSSNIYVSHAIDLIRKSYGKEITVGTVADYIGISRTHLNNSFQKELGTTVQNFIIDVRLQKAANLLISTTDSISSIAALVGYHDALTFSKMFKKKFQQSPKFYRQEMQAMDHGAELQIDHNHTT